MEPVTSLADVVISFTVLPENRSSSDDDTASILTSLAPLKYKACLAVSEDWLIPVSMSMAPDTSPVPEVNTTAEDDVADTEEPAVSIISPEIFPLPDTKLKDPERIKVDELLPVETRTFPDEVAEAALEIFNIPV